MMSNQQIECLTFATASSSPGGAFVQSANRFHQILYGTLTPRIPGKILYIPGQELAFRHLDWPQDNHVRQLVLLLPPVCDGALCHLAAETSAKPAPLLHSPLRSEFIPKNSIDPSSTG